MVSPSLRCHEADRRDERVQPVGPKLTTTNTKKLIERIIVSKCEVVKLGVDAHACDVVVCRTLCVQLLRSGPALCPPPR